MYEMSNKKMFGKSAYKNLKKTIFWKLIKKKLRIILNK